MLDRWQKSIEGMFLMRFAVQTYGVWRGVYDFAVGKTTDSHKTLDFSLLLYYNKPIIN